MPTARELLEQADALMRRNRARQVDTEVPELSEVIPMPATTPPAPPVALADIPELTDAVEEIEIASILEIPDDDADSNEWLRSDDKDLAAKWRNANKQDRADIRQMRLAPAMQQRLDGR